MVADQTQYTIDSTTKEKKDKHKLNFATVSFAKALNNLQKKKREQRP